MGGVLILTLVVYLLQVFHESKTHSLSRYFMTAFLIEKKMPASLQKTYQKFIQNHNQQAAWNDDIQLRSVWGYVDRHSITPGETFQIMLSTDPIDQSVSGHIEIYRIGYYPDGDRRKVWESSTITVQERKLYNSSGIIGPGWPVTLDNIPTQTWQSGYYTMDFVNRKEGRDADIAYIVVTPSQPDGDILVKLSTNTYQAYNEWGGATFYRSPLTGRAEGMVSFDRPTPSEFFRWEFFYVLWLEQNRA